MVFGLPAFSGLIPHITKKRHFSVNFNIKPFKPLTEICTGLYFN